MSFYYTVSHVAFGLPCESVKALVGISFFYALVILSEREMFRMTLEKAFDMAKSYPMPEQQKVINFVISIMPKQLKRTDIADSGLDFGENITDENHDERMARAFALAEDIEIDEQAIRELREASMV